MLDITNTARDKRTMLDETTEMITASEAHGQAELVNSCQLPTDVRGDKSKLESLGVVFGKPCDDDPLFCYATLPEGWKKVATDHSQWSKLVDAEGNEQAMIFYKAAFHDRCAFLTDAATLLGAARSCPVFLYPFGRLVAVLLAI